MAPQSPSSKAKPTEKAQSQMRSTPPLEMQNPLGISPRLLEISSSLSDEQLTRATMTAQRLAMQEAISMLQRRNAQYEIALSKNS